MSDDSVIWAGGQSFNSPEECEWSFCHQLYDVMLLLGSPKEIADLINKIPDRSLTKDDFLKLNNFALDLHYQAKMRLAHLHTIKIKPSNEQTL